MDSAGVSPRFPRAVCSAPHHSNDHLPGACDGQTPSRRAGLRDLSWAPVKLHFWPLAGSASSLMMLGGSRQLDWFTSEGVELDLHSCMPGRLRETTAVDFRQLHNRTSLLEMDSTRGSCSRFSLPPIIGEQSTSHASVTSAVPIQSTGQRFTVPTTR